MVYRQLGLGSRFRSLLGGSHLDKSKCITDNSTPYLECANEEPLAGARSPSRDNSRAVWFAIRNNCSQFTFKEFEGPPRLSILTLKYNFFIWTKGKKYINLVVLSPVTKFLNVSRLFQVRPSVL